MHVHSLRFLSATCSVGVLEIGLGVGGPRPDDSRLEDNEEEEEEEEQRETDERAGECVWSGVLDGWKT